MARMQIKLLGLLVASVSSIALAQQTRPSQDRAGNPVDLLLQELLQSERERARRRNDGAAKSPREIDHAKALPHLRHFAEEADHLSRELHSDASRDSRLRPIVVSLQDIRRRAGYLSSNQARSLEPPEFTRQVKRLHAQWRTAAVELRHYDQLGPGCTRCIQQVTRCCDQVVSAFALDPEPEYSEVLATAGNLEGSATQLAILLDTIAFGSDVYFELRYGSRKMKQQARYLVEVAEGQAPANVLSRELNRLITQLRELTPQLAKLSNPALARSTHSIWMEIRRMRGLLWMESPGDRAHLNHLFRSWTHRLADLSSQITIAALAGINDPHRVINRFNELVRDCGQLASTFQGDGPLGNTQAQFLRTVQSWQELAREVRPLPGSAVQRAIDDVEWLIAAIGQTLYLHPMGLEEALLASAARLENFSEHLDHYLSRQANQITPNFRTAVVRASDQFRQLSYQFHLSAAKKYVPAHLTNHCNQLRGSWAQLDGIIRNLNRTGLDRAQQNQALLMAARIPPILEDIEYLLGAR